MSRSKFRGFKPNMDKDFMFSTTGGADHIKKIIENARKSGSLNLSNREFSEVPDTVWRLNEPPEKPKEPVDFSATDDGAAWWETTALVKLILAHNKLTVLPDLFHKIDTLVVLDLQGNQLSSLPESIGQLVQLKSLTLCSNNLSNLPDSFSYLTNLVSLLAKNNKFTALPDSITHMSDLELLDFSDNMLKCLPDRIGNCKGLNRIFLKSNQLERLPVSFSHLLGLNQLDLADNKLSSLPQLFKGSSILEILDLRQNKLNQIPNFSEVNNLKELHLAHNLIEDLSPFSLEKLTSLVVLDLGSNKLNTIPEEITQLKMLTRLDLTSNNLSNIPANIGFMENLRVLLLECNPLRGMIRDLPKGTEHVKKMLQTRSVSGDTDQQTNANSSKRPLVPSAQLDIFKTSLAGISSFHVPQTNTLKLTDHKLDQVPDEVWSELKDVEIKSVNLEKNCLKELPQGIFLFAEHLQSLILSQNAISSLPNDISLLIHLQRLDISNNNISSLPASISELRSLYHVNISFNSGITALPPALYDLPSLTELLATSCRIREIDSKGITKLTNLGILDLTNNDINHVPPELGLCQSIRSLQLDGNCFKMPRSAILAKGTQAIMEYLRDRIPAS